MQEFHMFMCDVCGFSRERAGICPWCSVPLSEYTKETQREYQVDMEEAMRMIDGQRWYV